MQNIKTPHTNLRGSYRFLKKVVLLLKNPTFLQAYGKNAYDIIVN